MDPCHFIVFGPSLSFRLSVRVFSSNIYLTLLFFEQPRARNIFDCYCLQIKYSHSVIKSEFATNYDVINNICHGIWNTYPTLVTFHMYKNSSATHTYRMQTVQRPNRCCGQFFFTFVFDMKNWKRKSQKKDKEKKMVEINSEMENVVDLDGKLRATILSTWILNKIQCGIRNKGRERKNRNKH